MRLKNKMMFLFLCFILLFSYIPIIQADSTSGYVVNPQYERVQNFSEGLAAVFIDEYWGYIDKEGIEVIPPKYDYALPFREGLAAVATDGRWGFIDKTGTIAIKPQFDTIDIQPDDIGGFSEGLAAVSLNDRWGYIDKSGKVIIEPQFDYAFSFYEGLAPVLLKDKWGYINQQGEIIIDFMYESALPFSEGAAAVFFFDGWGFINKEGDAFTGFVYSSPSSFKDGLAPVDEGFIDLNGALIIDFLDEHYYDMADPFHDGIAMVYKIMQREYYYGFMDRHGKEIIAPQFPFIRQVQFREGMGAIYENDRWGFIDRTGKIIIDPQFEDISGDFNEGVVGVSVNGKWGFINANFNNKAPTKSTEAPSNWAVEEVMDAIKLDLIPEHMNKSYTTHINRQQFSELIVSLFSVIDDLSIDDWMKRNENNLSKDLFDDTDHPMVLAAHYLGIVNGKGHRKFDPYGEITRQEAAVMLQRAAQKLELRASENVTPYADQSAIANWAKEGVMLIAALKDKTVDKAVMNGVAGNRFDPAGKYTREQAFITIKRLYHAF